MRLKTQELDLSGYRSCAGLIQIMLMASIPLVLARTTTTCADLGSKWLEKNTRPPG